MSYDKLQVEEGKCIVLTQKLFTDCVEPEMCNVNLFTELLILIDY